jgi:UDP:flavonoid glycosyltransferase YjiC (YdhE family)
MVVSDLPEMASVVRRFNVGAVMDGTGARSLAEAVRKVLAREWNEAGFAQAREDMDWNKEKQKLIEIIEKI